MANETAQVRGEWNYLAVLVSLFGAIVLQSVALPCSCYRGTVNLYLAGAVDAIVIFRFIIARVRKEHGRGWVFYSLLPFLIVPAILLIEYFCVP